jgi:hypothetical protein
MTRAQHRRGVNLSKYDVVLVTASVLQERSPWILAYNWETVIADEAHDFLRGQKIDKERSITLQNWSRLQDKTRSIFLLTGTPSMTDIAYDFQAITKAIANETVRRKWDPSAEDAYLKELVRGWIPDLTNQPQSVVDEQNALRRGVSEMLATYTIQRDENSVIAGKPVLRDFVGECEMIEDSLPRDDEGYQTSLEIYRKIWPSRQRSRKGSTNVEYTISYNEIMRCLR